MPVGNEGAGTVVAAGESPAARALLGKVVAAAGGGMYSQYRSVNVALCLELPAGATAIEGAASFVNPLTLLGMVETMRREKVIPRWCIPPQPPTLARCLARVCLEERVGLVNIVRKPDQVATLARLERSTSAIRLPRLHGRSCRRAGGDRRHTCLRRRWRGRVVSQILTAMEAAANTASGGYSGYGSTVHKQVYLYGFLDHGRPS